MDELASPQVPDRIWERDVTGTLCLPDNRHISYSSE